MLQLEEALWLWGAHYGLGLEAKRFVKVSRNIVHMVNIEKKKSTTTVYAPRSLLRRSCDPVLTQASSL